MSNVDEINSSVHQSVREYFEKHLTQGEVLSVKELETFVQKHNLPRQNRRQLQNLKYEYKASAVRRPFRKVKLFASTSLDLPGNIDVDFCEYLRKYKQFNSGNVGYIIAVSHLSSQISTYPVKNKSSESYEKAIAHFVSVFTSGVWSITSDNEAALSKSFRQQMFDRFGLHFKTIQTRSKASLAERAIRTTKTRLTLAMEARREVLEKNLGRKLTISERNKSYRWIELLETVTANLNSIVITGTHIKRSKMTPDLVFKVLEEKWKTKVPLNALSEGLRDKWPENFKDLFFRFQIGSIVHLARDSYYKEKQAFSKHSISGAYHPIQFKIKARVVRTSKTGVIIPVYKIAYKSNGSVLDGIFYERDLTPSHYKESGSSDSEEEENKEDFSI